MRGVVRSRGEEESTFGSSPSLDARLFLYNGLFDSLMHCFLTIGSAAGMDVRFPLFDHLCSCELRPVAGAGLAWQLYLKSAHCLVCCCFLPCFVESISHNISSLGGSKIHV